MSPFRVLPTFDSFFREMNRLQGDLESVFGRGFRRGAANSFPALNVWEDNDSVFVEAELPGFQLTDLEVFVASGDQLTIKGERKPLEHDKSICHRQERGFGAFTRSITLPVAVDADEVQARLEHGVLHLTLPKSPIAKPKKITIST
jgi:HSP20 family protein